MALCLGAGRVLEFFLRNLISRHLSLLERSPLSFRLKFTPFWLVLTTVECMTGKTICICSDIRAALLALSSHTVSSGLVAQCQNSLQGLSLHKRAQLFWVPGHCGIIGNEEADGLVGVGSQSSFCKPEPRH
jgi:hypothetical protein